jgi:hypothetical protein
MQTICVLDEKIMMSQAGEHLATMKQNASQYPGAVASIVTDAEYALLTAPTLADSKAANKATASSLLAGTDWTTIADVASPTNNPYLANQADFIAYRNVIRAIAVYPPAGEVVWATPPTEVWLQGE